MSLLQVTNLGRKINDHWLWTHVSFSLIPGMRLGLVGASGSGKTLLMRALAGLDSVDRGYISFGDRPLSQWSMPHYRSQVLYLAQRPSIGEGTVEEIIRAVFQFKLYRDRRYDADLVNHYFRQLGRADEFLNRPATHLSGGESQLVALVRALQLHPKILILDEPTASLDPDTAHQVEALINDWVQQSSDRAYIWTSHDPAQSDRISDQHIRLGQPFGNNSPVI